MGLRCATGGSGLGDRAACSRAASRKRLRACRRAVPAQLAWLAARAAARRALALPAVARARRVGVYFASDGELDPAPLVRALWRAGRAVYLPVGTGRHRALVFRRYRPDAGLVPDMHGIPAPADGEERPARALDVIVLPVVAFDARGHRLGRGGGHYDRTLAAGAHAARPLRVGYAYDAQRVPQLTPARWDVPLDAVITPRRVWRRGRAFEAHTPVF
jgi:5-formyltetrahydrofolate cyclo-ligase